MSILKIRDEHGNIRDISIMKGDKGDGVPDGGTTGQVIRKTEAGTEWADISVKNTAILTNTDTSVKSVSITKRGLYEVKAKDTTDEYIFILSISDLYKTVKDIKILGVSVANSQILRNELRCIYASGEVRVTSIQETYNNVSQTIFSNSNYYLSEVTLLIPYD